MTETERLRALLDELGVEYDVDDTQVDGNGTMYRVTYVKEGYGRTWVYEEPPECGLLVSYAHDLGAEDAIAATLGAGTCKPREVRSRFSKTQEYVTYHCECGHELGGYMTAELPFPHTYNEDELPNYCPNCGRRIVQEDA
jgi:hypothetical protein